MQKDTYLDLLARYDIKSAHPGGMVLTKQLLRREKITPETRLLDVGCGTGQTSAYIATYYPCQVIAVDINPKMLEKATIKFRQANLNIKSYQANAMELPFPKNTFDILLSESVTIFTESVPRTLQEYQRVLKPNGILLAIEGTALLHLNQAELNELKTVIGIMHLPTKEQWCEMFQTANFSNTEVLALQRMPLQSIFPSRISRVFREYRNTMYNHRHKFGYGIYRSIV